MNIKELYKLVSGKCPEINWDKFADGWIAAHKTGVIVVSHEPENKNGLVEWDKTHINIKKILNKLFKTK